MADLPKVTYLLQDVPALYGAERVTLDLLTALQRRGVGVDLLFIGETRLGLGADAFAVAARRAGLPVKRLEVDGRFSWPLVQHIRQHLAGRPGGVLHTLGYKAHLHGLLAARGRAPTVTTLHGWLVRPEVKERLYEKLEVYLLRRDRAVICLSRFYEEMLLGQGVKRERVFRIPSGLPADQLPSAAQAASWPDAPFTVALIGRLSWEKNHDVLLRALSRLHLTGRNVHAVFAGDGPERAAVASRIRQLGLQEQIEMVGYVRIAELMPKMHAICLCSRIENMPLSLLEAMAWQRPVVATRVGGIPDVVEDQVTGYLVPDDDEQALADALGRLESNPAQARAMGRAGRLRVEHVFSLSRCVEQHVELYRHLVAP